LVLLLARLGDAFVDPYLGRWTDSRFAKSASGLRVICAGLAVVLAIGFAALFMPPAALAGSPTHMLIYAAVALAVTYVAYSGLSIAHQAWGARYEGTQEQRARVVSWREGCGLLGVVAASVLPSLIGFNAVVVTFAVVLALGYGLWLASAVPHIERTATAPVNTWHPFKSERFRKLLIVFVINGIASAIPATLVLFFIQDRLQASAQSEGQFLAIYFMCAAASLPLWLKVVAKLGAARTWLIGMVLAIVVFVWAAQLGVGDTVAFMLICALSGVALGTDLSLPSAMLAETISREGDMGTSEGAYFGWWNFATKLNLALSAGLALPFLAAFGYAPGARDAQALQALTLAYCVLPCVLKVVASLALWQWFCRTDSLKLKVAAS
jgi:Na+/melibiose symporter-like transporter